MPTGPLWTFSSTIFEQGFHALTESIDGNGVAATGDLKVTDGTGDMEHDIAPGTARYNTTTASLGSVTTVTLSDGDGTDDRWDLIAFDVSTGSVVKREGTAEATPSPPDLQADEVLLAHIYVEQGETDTQSGDINDRRVLHPDAAAVAYDDATGQFGASNINAALDELQEAAQIGAYPLAQGDLASGSVGTGEVIDGSLANADLANSAVTVTAGDGLKNGGSVALGASTTLDVEPADFAGAGLADDGSDNLEPDTQDTGTITASGGASPAADTVVSTTLSQTDAYDVLVYVDADPSFSADYQYNVDWSHFWDDSTSTVKIDFTVNWDTDPGSSNDVTLRWEVLNR